jgi:hypothetical protein
MWITRANGGDPLYIQPPSAKTAKTARRKKKTKFAVQGEAGRVNA